MDWEHKFTSIVRETELNLAKVKQRLGASRSFSTNVASPALIRGDSPGLHSHEASRGFDGRVVEADSVDAPDNSGIPEISRGLNVVQSSGVLMLLSDKLDAQTRAMENLSLTVKRLEDEKDSYEKQIKDLKDELTRVDSRMAERGVDLQTEHKVDQWRRDVAAEMQHLHSQLRQQRSAREDGENTTVSQTAAFIRDLHDMKRNFQDEMNSVRRDVESIKNRLLRVEADVASFSTDNRDISRRHDRIEQNLIEMRERQNLAASLPAFGTHSMASVPGAGVGVHPGAQNTLTNTEVAELRSSLKLLENKLARVESKARASSSPNGHGKSDDKYDLSPPSSELDLSDLSSDDLDFDLTTNPTGVPGKSGGDSLDGDIDLGLTTDDLISTGVDTEDDI